MPAFTTLPRAKALPVSPSKWSLLTCGLFALTPLPCALAETAKVDAAKPTP